MTCGCGALEGVAPPKAERRRPARVATALFALAAVWPATRCGESPVATDPETAHSPRVVVGVRGDVSSFNPYTATNAFTQEIADLLFPRLLEESIEPGAAAPSFAPQLATAFRRSADGLVLTFELDPAARWSDGRPITASDVLFSHRVASDPDVGWVGREVKDSVISVTAADEHTVVYRFERNYPYQLMDAAEGNIVPRHVWGATAPATWPSTPFLEAPVAGGPFALARYEPGTLIELERNGGVAEGTRPRLERVVFRVIPDAAAQVAELLSGGIDVLVDVPEEAIERIEAGGRHEIVRVPDLSYAFIGWNTARPPFDDARVRRALTAAIDREALIEGLIPRTGRPIAGPFPSLSWAHDPSLEPLDYDPASARRLLAAAGWEDEDGDGVLERGGRPFRFELDANQESLLRGRIAEVVAAQLAALGVRALPRRFEFATFIERHERHDFDAFVGSWRESTRVDLKNVFHGDAAEGGYNYGAYADPELDRVIDEARAAGDPAAARALWHEAQRIIARDQPYTFLFERDRLHAVPLDLDGFEPSPQSALRGVERWHWSAAGSER